MSAPPGGFQITIGGVDYTGYVDLEKIQIESNLAIMLDTCKLVVAVKNQAIARPKSGQEVVVTSNLGREFGGTLVHVEESQPGVPTELDYQVTTRDYSFLLDRKVAFKEYPANTWTYQGIVEDLIASYGSQDGFVSTDVQQSFQAPYTRFDYQPTAQSINQLAQQIAFGFYVDYNRDAHFFSSESYASPLPSNTLQVDTATTIPDPTYGSLGVYGDLKIVEDATQLRNRIYLYGHKVTASYTYSEHFTGDGQTKTFGLAYEPSHSPANVTVTVGGVQYAIAADVAGGVPSNTTQDYTAYINYDSQVIRFNVAPGNGVAVSAVYKPMLPLVVMVEDPSKQKVMAARIGGADDGVFEYAIADPTLSADTIGPSVARGQEQITKYGLPHITGQFTSYLHGWRAGQSFTLRSTKRFGGELDGMTFYVTKVGKEVVAHPVNSQPLFKSTISFSDSIYVY